MMIPCDKLQELAASVEPVSRALIVQFLTEAEAKAKAEIEAAKNCLSKYGFKVYEDQHHIVHEVA